MMKESIGLSSVEDRDDLCKSISVEWQVVKFDCSSMKHERERMETG